MVGATGNVGRGVVEGLDRLGVAARPAGTDPQRTSDAFPGHEVARLDLSDPVTFGPALRGARSMFLLRPPPVARVGPTLNALVDEAARQDVAHVVFSSVAGADTNMVVPHHRVETHLRSSGLPYTILRPGFFAQNLGDAYRRDISDDDRIFLLAGDARVAFVDTADVAEVAARVLADPTPHLGAGYHLTGPAAVTFNEVTAVLSGALGRQIRYEPSSVWGYVRHLRRRRHPLVQIAVQTTLHVGLRRGDAETVDPTLGRLLGRPPRTLAEYVADHVELWR